MNPIPSLPLRMIAVMIALVAFAGDLHADIFQWEYINPAEPSLGKQQSTKLCPGGAGVDAVPRAYFPYRDLTMAYLIGADLTGDTGSYVNLTNADLSQANLTFSYFPYATLTGADFHNANLTNGYFGGATLTGADFTGAQVRAASFYRDPYFFPAGGISLAQLYSTASYQAHDLSGISLIYNDLT